MRTRFSSRTLVVAAVLLFLATPSAVDAAYTSTVAGTTATMTGDVAGDTLIITQSLGVFRHNRSGLDPGFNSDADFDTTMLGDQTVPSATGIININAGDGNDAIALGDGVNLRGSIDGGVGTDTLDYSASTAPIVANLGLGALAFTGTLGGDQQNPQVATAAAGTATASNYSISAHTFDITVTVTGLAPANVTGFHIHQGQVGVNGGIIVDFTGMMLTPVGDGFTFVATGLVLPALSEAAFLGGGTYVNVHTAAFPNGIIRGQLFSTANANVSPGIATGTTSVANVENVTGGTGSDSLVGNSLVNTINGGSGADWIVAGQGNDTLSGGAGADVLVWSNGDGTDVDEGGADGDTVQVNGNTANGDVFTVTPNGTRLRFDRTSAGPFSLDIGTVETLIVNGIGGNDTFTVSDLAGVATLTTLNLNGFDGNDTMTFAGTSAGAVVFNALGGPGTDTLQGPNGAATWNVTAANLGNVAGLVTSFSFIEALVGGTASDAFNVRAFATGTPSVAGGAGTDTLNYNAESRAVSGDTTPPDGLIDSPGVQSLTFTQMEAVNIINPQPTITISDVTVGEGANAIFNVSLSNPSLLTVTVNFATADGTATAPGDYTSQSATLTFVPGDTLETISVPIIADALLDPGETFVVNLSGAVNATIADAQGQATITEATMSLDKTALTFGAVTNGTTFTSQTSPQPVRLTQSGSGSVSWTAASGAPWLVVSPTSGTGSATLTISTQWVAGLVATQTANVTLTFTGASNTTGQVAVRLNTTTSTAGAPFGAFDTPVDGTTGVTGSLGVTGWALDDIEVTNVRILRDPVAGEPAGALVFIGNATLVDGARPDVEALYPTTPRNTRAGFGYLMLTNFLPNLGTGTFRIYAIADDADGHSTTLGTKTITCTNNTATTPFGAIDTPGQGDTVTGPNVTNFGWVLSPNPRRADPPGGGTVQVVIDGVFQSFVPAGWTSRPDLTALFPESQFAGIVNALGVANIDSTVLTNGVHTLAWVVTDNLGTAVGIGSRFFTVSNSALMVDPTETAGVTRVADVDAAPRDFASIQGRRGFSLDTPLDAYEFRSGRATVQAEELDRIELRLGDTPGESYAGYLRVGDQLRSLPSGSALNQATGEFTWMPGAGFIGAYDLVFVRQSGGRAVARQDVRVVLNPRRSRVGPQTMIDMPAPGTTVAGPSFVLAGWAADLDSAVDRGVATLHVWAYPVNGGDPIWIGEAAYGVARPDVAAIHGDRFLTTGYGITVQGLAPGTYDLAVFAWSSVTQGFVPAKTVRVTVQ